MNEATRHEIVQRHQQGTSRRAIARELGISRGAVGRVLAQVQAQRDGQAAPVPKPRRRGSILDAYEPILQELLAQYPNLTVERALQELQARGFRGQYTIVRQRLRLLRPRATSAPVARFETGPAEQAQMDYGVYDLDFTREGRRRVYLFSYLLSYSRRQYLRFVEAMDLPTTLREHVHAFHYLGGAARVCLYDNFKVVVLRHDADGPLYNPKFLAFATHYGFKPWACGIRRPQTKGKVERKFLYVETSLLNGRTFETLAHLNDVTTWWLAQVADVRRLRDFRESPFERYQRERPQLLPLPACDFDTAQVVYRHVNVEGYIAHRLNLYSVPWSYIGQVLPVRVTETEVVIYSISLDEIARHLLVPGTVTGQRQQIKGHHRTDDPAQRALLLRQRFSELGPVAVQFLDGLLAKQVQGKLQAQHLLALLGHYQRADVLAALERANRFGAFSLAAVRRILAAQARPKPLLEELAELHREALDPSLREESIGPRPTSDYQHLLLAKESGDEKPAAEKPQDHPDKGRSEPA
ncbi:MAG: IS21 family transposase [Planctomycetota bacterium]|nr:MAG: IS21 family transposase [Planctomycetota bacterium]HMC63891.1 IS21 family transposase [Gemmataceae bacterium]